MNLGDRVVISKNNHPLYRFTGTIVGRRGFRIVRDTMLLILINERQRSYLIPESMVNLVSDSTPDVENDLRFN